MNPEKLHDALDLLDEDLILPVEQLRRRKPFRWQHLGALAACLAVVCVIGVLAHGLAWDMGSGESVSEDGLVSEMVPEAEVADTQSGRKETQPQNIVPGVDLIDGDLQVLLMETILVEVTKIEQDRFTATVLQSDQFHSKGDTVTIHLTELTRIIRGLETENALPVDDFSEGSVLVVNYTFDQDRAVIAECITFGE